MLQSTKILVRTYVFLQPYIVMNIQVELILKRA